MSDVSDAVQGTVEEGEIVVAFVLVAEVSRGDGGRHLVHRSGGMTGAPYAWTALGMLQASARLAEEQVLAGSRPVE